MVTYEGAGAYLPAKRSIPALAEAVNACRGCDLYRDASQAVFGAGPDRARAVFVGEVPGDREDRTGEPFVGPAGALLDRALDEAGIDRAGVYVTNAVKHFRFTRAQTGARADGGRRIHKKPSRSQIVACRPWLLAELDAVLPRVVVCLGATAAQSLLGPDFRVGQSRGQLLEPAERAGGALVLATVHPSSILRARDDDRRDAHAAFVADLRVAATAL
ncbi:UdgX family uracil-DNA binding protein [Saccharomonospora saliphila]|uniref:UdgX family uracil-DNA binding protein n=1 Tax=Saccharomonospora saliphila TaxID=369829 RepID=UPI0003646E59|nr:UdgX family uracil-DNA binding protein [Saccharomonospora saliphila]